MNKKVLSLTITIGFVAFSLISGAGFAAPSSYDAKTIRIIVGFAKGGGYDTYARVMSRHIGKYIPGKPSIIVENMEGEESLICANYIYKVAKPDGLTIGHFNGGLFFKQALQEPGIEFDGRKFVFLGAAAKEGCVYAFSKKSGITSMEKWMGSKTPVVMGGVAPGAYEPDNVIRILQVALGLPIRLVSGYPSVPAVRKAVDSGEVDGSSMWWPSMKSAWSKPLESGDVVVVLQAVPEPFPDLPKVPLCINYAKNEEERQLIEIGIHLPNIFARPFVLPPGTPKEETQVLTKAFMDMLKDKDFLAEAEKAKLDIEPVSASDLGKVGSLHFKAG